jgi:hypothetical protein
MATSRARSGPAPEIVAPERAELRARRSERHRLRVQRGAARLVQAVGEAARDEVESALREPEHEQLAWPTLKTASAIGTWRGSAARALAVRTWRCGTTSTASSPAGGRSARAAPRETTKPPSSAAATLSGGPRARRERRMSASSSKIESAASSPAT